MRLWLDDIREAPDGWHWVKTAPDAVAALAAGTVDEISLDHDLGDDEKSGTGNTVVCWIEEAVAMRAFVPPKMLVHSKNCVGAAKMLAGIASIDRVMLERRLVTLVDSILRSVDAEGLLRAGAPDDKYMSEAQTLAHAIARGTEITPEYVRDVWLCFFGCGESADGVVSVHAMPMRDAFRVIAEEINDSLELGRDEELWRALRERRADTRRSIPHAEVERQVRDELDHK